MDKLIELLEQIKELAGVGIDALKGAAGGEGGKPEGGKPPAEGGGEPKPEPDGDEPPAGPPPA
jgi:hypothetical protein